MCLTNDKSGFLRIWSVFTKRKIGTFTDRLAAAPLDSQDQGSPAVGDASPPLDKQIQVKSQCYDSKDSKVIAGRVDSRRV